MSKLNPLYERGDVKYFYNLHKQRQAEMGNQPVGYRAFYQRLKRGMSLKEAIYTPRMKTMSNKHNMKPKRGYNKFKSNLHFLRIRFISFFN